jgi:PAS domain S-box-containing protein
LQFDLKQTLQASEEQFRQVIVSISDHVYVTEITADGSYINRYISPNVAALTGYPWEKFTNDWSFWASSVIHPDDRAAAAAQAERLAAGQNGEMEYRMTRADGEVIWVRDSGRVERQGESKIIYGVVSNVTPRKLAEERVRHQASLIQNVSDAIISTDLNFMIQSWNRAAETIYGWQANEVRGKWLNEVIPAEPLDIQTKEMTEKFFSAGEWSGEVIQKRKDGAVINILTSVSLLRDGAGDPVGAVAVNRDITARKQAEESLRQKVSDLDVLYGASQVFLGQSNVATTLQMACRLVVERFELEMSWVGLITKDDFDVYPVAAYSADHQSYVHSIYATWDDSPSGQGPTGRAIRTAQAVATNRLESDPTYEPWRQAAMADGYFSTAALPLLYGQEVLGVLNVYSVEPEHFTADQLQILQSFANLTAVALAKARLFEQAQRRLEELTAIYRASQHLQQLHTPETLSQEIIRSLEETLAYDYGAVLLIEQATGRLIPFALSDQGQGSSFVATDKAYLASHDIRLGVGLIGWVAQTGQSVCLGDVRQDPRYRPIRANIRSKLCVPLHIGEQIIGVVNVETTKLNAYTEADQRVLETVAAQIAIATQNARLFDQVRVARERLQLLSHQLVDAQEAERRHIARELHDEIGQTLTAVKINLQAMQRSVDASALASRLEESMGIVEQAIQQVRKLSLDLRPSLLDDLGLVATLRWYLDRQTKWAGFTPQFTAVPPEMRLPSNLETVCFRVVQEALTNVMRHAQAQLVRVELQQYETELQLLILDDGVGFEVEVTLERVAQGTGLGLLGMQERVALLGGRIEIDSAPGRGTQIRVYLPLPSDAPHLNFAESGDTL